MNDSDPTLATPAAPTAGSSANVRAVLVRKTIDVSRLMPLAWHRHVLFLMAHHKVGNFSRPTSFSEKVNWRIIHDRRAILRLTCDKLHSRETAQSLGIPAPETVWYGESLDGLVGTAMPDHWVLKPNDGSGQVTFGAGAVRDVSSLRAVTDKWPKKSPPAMDGEWAYKHARRLYIIERMLGTGRSTPVSYKFFCFDGEPRYVHVIAVGESRFDRWRQKVGARWPPEDTPMRFYTPAWEPRDAQLADFPLAKVAPRPPALDSMLEAAAKLARGFDMMRVDFMGDGETFVFGELTPYPHAGLTRFNPSAFDLELGAHWTLPQL